MASQPETRTELTVTIRNRVSVYPKTLHPPKILNLSNLDRQCPNLMYLVLFYKSPSDHHANTNNSVFSSLQSGLEETLSFWYPAAGRLKLNPNDGKLNLWCNNEGAVLVEAVTQVKLSELGDLSQYNELFEKLVYKPVFNPNLSDMPLVVAQVTKFGCGGYSVGVGASHSLFDGPATFDFLSAWASNSEITKQKASHDQLQLTKPVHDRGPLLSVANNSLARMTKMRATAIDHLYQLIQQALGSDRNLGADQRLFGDRNPYVLKTFHLSDAMIKKLKMKILGEKKDGFSCSSFEAVAAHLWKARTKALGVDKEKMVCLQFSMDIRNKIQPSLPKGFAGNAFVLVSVTLTAGELERESNETIIEKIKQAKNCVNNDYVNAYMEALDGSESTVLPPLEELTMVSDWTRMPFHKVELLPGNAVYASPLVSPVPQVAYFMQNPIDFRGIDVRIGLPPQALDAFSHYFFMSMY
ncbi:brassinosteroid-related acyltransferase 1 [Mercurialis annua]|uniref:brassinosteroid-related acyltransferase 1 n=1 Tax=Mercurialis annua TaxID=3986 RepID=UPI00215FF0D4|nr:brassinosteroid-related acyltransferase 1 [Mercurialis annua]